MLSSQRVGTERLLEDSFQASEVQGVRMPRRGRGQSPARHRPLLDTEWG